MKSFQLKMIMLNDCKILLFKAAMQYIENMSSSVQYIKNVISSVQVFAKEDYFISSNAVHLSYE